MSVHTSYICYNGTAFGFYIAATSLTLPLLAWYGIKGLGYYDKELVFLILNLTWFPEIMINVMLQNTFCEPKLCMADGNEGELLYGNPSLETQLFFSFSVFVILFNYLRNKSMNLSYLLGLLFFDVFIIWGLWWTGNYEFVHLLNGAIVGTICGASIAVAIEIYFLEDFEILLNTKLIKKMNYYDTLCTENSEQIKPNIRNAFFLIEDIKTN